MLFHFSLLDETALTDFAADLAYMLKLGDFIALYGDLGVGKSTLARAIIRTLADDATLEVPSPTFTLLQHYETRHVTITHADLYRISHIEEMEELGLSQALEEGILLVEWPQNAQDSLPEPNFSCLMEYEDAGRKLTLKTTAEAGQRLSRSLTIRGFLNKNGRKKAKRRYFTGDASLRRYEKIYDAACPAPDHNYQLLMDAPALNRPGIKEVKDYAKSVHLAQDISQFVGIDRLLAEKGFRVPHILAANINEGLLLTDHFSCEGLLDTDRLPVEERYLAAVRLLAELHEMDWPRVKIFNDLTLHIPSYNAQVMQHEVTLFLDWYLPHQDIVPDETMRRHYHDIWADLFDVLQQAQQTLVLRDYHSPNLFWHPDEKDNRRIIGLIDFQDAQIGPFTYDIASLAQDARVTITPELEKNLLAAYVQAREAHMPHVNAENFHLFYAITAAQRVSKIMGLFVRLKKRDSKPHYILHLPRLIDYLERSLNHPRLHRLADFYRDIIPVK